MIRAFYGIEDYPFAAEGSELLIQQQEIYDTLRVHCQQGGLCLVLGVPGTGKTMIKEALQGQADHKRMLVVTVARTLHTYPNTIKILCDAFSIDHDGSPFKCEKRLIEEAYSLNRQGKMLVIIIDDAHLLKMETFRKLRLLFEDFPKNHNVILVGQPPLMSDISLSVNEDIKSRVTYSVFMRRLNPDTMQEFILAQLDALRLAKHFPDLERCLCDQIFLPHLRWTGVYRRSTTRVVVRLHRHRNHLVGRKGKCFECAFFGEQR
jgi:type II secretory pathway predicted ATPase ExeA